MQTPKFEPVANAGLDRLRPGSAPTSRTPGDFILTHGDSFVSKASQFGEKLRIHGDDRKFAWYNHAALVPAVNGEIVEALGRAVVASNAEDYLQKDYVVVHSGADPEDIEEIGLCRLGTRSSRKLRLAHNCEHRPDGCHWVKVQILCRRGIHLLGFRVTRYGTERRYLSSPVIRCILHPRTLPSITELSRQALTAAKP
jgi:hypothetical protein